MARRPLGFRASDSAETAAVFARVPVAHAERLDRAAYALGRPKREILSALLSVLEVDEAGATVGRHSFAAAGSKEVLTLQEAAALLEVSPDAVRELCGAGGLPGRDVGGEWRFARTALLEWLAGRD